MALFEDVKISDVCRVGDGAHASIQRQDHGVMYLSSRNFKDGRLELSKVYYISEENFKKHFRETVNSITKPAEGDVVLSIIGTIGEPYVVKPDDIFGLSSAVAILRPDKSKAIPSYLYHWLKSPEFQQAVSGIKGGVAQGYVSLEMIKSLPFRKFNIDKQNEISEILSAYESLIENGNRRIAILENMAQSLYREWFVNFRFPGHENCKFVDSPLGKVPEGWGVKPASDIFNINIGKTPPRNQSHWFTKNDDDLKWLSIRDIGASQIFSLDTSEKLTMEGVKKFGVKIIPAGTVVLSFKLTVGKVAITADDMATNEAIAHFNIKNIEEISKEYTYCYLKDFSYQTLGNTSSIGNAINSQIVKSLPVLIPPVNLIGEFNILAEGLFKSILVVARSNRNLKEQRDMLLPRLVSGQIELHKQ